MTIRLSKIAFLCAWIIAILIAVEISLQAYYRIKYGDWLPNRVGIPIYAEDPDRFFKVAPELSYNHATSEFNVIYYTNNLGFRTDGSRKTNSWKKPESANRVLVLGSSFTFGIGVDYEDTFLARIRAEFAESHPNLEILSIATPGQSIWQQRCWLEARGRELEVDLIVQIITGSGRLRHECDHDFALSPSVKDGFLYSARATRATRIRDTLKKLGIIYFGGQALLRTQLADTQKDPAFVELAPLWDSPVVSPARQIEAYRQYSDDVERILGPEPSVIFVHIPFNFVVDESYLNRWKRSGFSVEHAIQFRKFGLELARLLEDSGINFVSLIDGLVQMQQSEQAYNYIDIHFTPAGHRLLSAVLRDKISAAFKGTAHPEQD